MPDRGINESAARKRLGEGDGVLRIRARDINEKFVELLRKSFRSENINEVGAGMKAGVRQFRK